MRIIPFVNHKGGVGKTTCVINIGAILAALNSRVLLIDLDAQGNLCTGLRTPQNDDASIYDVLLENKPIQSVIRKSYLPKVDIVNASIKLAGIEYDLVRVPDHIYNLTQAFKSLEQDYDFILLDCPPSLGMVMVSAILASTEIIIPLQCEFFALNGLITLINVIKKLEIRYDRKIHVKGILPTMVDPRSRISREILNKIRTTIDIKIFDHVVPRNAKVVESNSVGEPLIIYDLNCSAAQAYLRVVKELLT